MKKMIKIICVIMLLLVCGCSQSSKSQSQDMLSGHCLTASDQSYLQLNKDGHYVWYQNKSVTNDNYYEGTYEVYVGMEAIDQLDSLSEYGFTKQEQLDYIERNKDKGISVDDWYVMIQTRTKRVVQAQETLEKTRIVYAGVYYKDKKVYDAVNCNSANYSYFSVE